MKVSHDDFSSIFFFASSVLNASWEILTRQARVMIHYICDRCKRQIRTADQIRYVVQIDIQTAADHHREEIDDDVDHLAELHQLLEGIVNANAEDDSSESSHHGRYDLCPECHRQFLKNPLGRDAMLALGFSNN